MYVCIYICVCVCASLYKVLHCQEKVNSILKDRFCVHLVVFLNSMNRN